jgi:peptide chain release factor 2
MRERQKLDGALSSVTRLSNELADAKGLIEMAEGEGDAAMVADAENALLALARRAEQMRLESMLSGEADSNDSYIEIHAGAGGTESQDWASMLLRMYTRWAERHDYKLQLIEESEGEGAGIKSTTLLVKGENAYGWLKSEAGVHRLVRISPFDSNARRHTSFSTFPKRMSASTSTAPRARAASMSTRPRARCASPICPPALRWPRRASAASIKIVPSAGTC